MFKSLFSGLIALSCLCGLVSVRIQAAAQGQAAPEPPKVTVDADGTVHVPAQVVPQSSFLTPEAKAYVTQHLIDMQNPEAVKQDAGVPRFMKPMLEWDRQNYALDRQDTKIAGVHVYVYTPKSGIAAENRKRVLINLHGGGFSGCWPACAVLESMPLSALMGMKVVSVDYREGPEYKFPAASEDVATVYKDLLKTYKPDGIGIYGCSAGGMLTAMSVAWFQAHDIPAPGAIGIYCASAGGFGGDATSFAFPAGEARLAGNFGSGLMRLGYFSTADPKNPLVSPIESFATLAKFPPTLLITGTRDFAFSGALYTDTQLSKLGVDSELHVWEGLFHGFFYKADVPESKDAFNVMIRFFDRHLAKD
jgi:acetyl esterase/lipase